MPYTAEQGTGYRAVDTSYEAAKAVEGKAPSLREQVLGVLKAERLPMTADAIAAKIGKPYISIRPRLTELKDAGQVVDSGNRGKGSFGKNCILWRVAE